MVLQYMLSDIGLPNRATVKSETLARKTKAEPSRTKRRALICFLLLAYIIVANIGYNLWAKGGNISVWKLLTANVIRDLWTTGKTVVIEHGTVTGILHSKGNSWALINHELVKEGDITSGIRVVKINKRSVEFEKNGERWTQKVQANPNSAWKTTKQTKG
jgi:hypothetical protein